MTEIHDSTIDLLRMARNTGTDALGLLDTALAELDSVTPWQDRIAEMPVNLHPSQPDLVRRKWTAWPIRGQGDCPLEITGLTIHHTTSHSPLATARYCTRQRAAGGKGYPTIQYHFWVSAGDDCPVFLLVDPVDALWHDHTGAYQTTLSIGMAGSLHKQRPPQEQLVATARLCAHLMFNYDVPVGEVRGHGSRAKAAGISTVCPGWYITGWKDDFYEALGAVL